MNLDHIGGAVGLTPVSTISFAVAVLCTLAIFLIKPILKMRKIEISDTSNDLMLICCALFIGAVAGVSSGVAYTQQRELVADSAAFTEQLKNDYGVSTQSPLNEVKHSATYERVIVMTDSKGDFEVRPRLDGYTLTFFRVDNGEQVKRLDS